MTFRTRGTACKALLTGTLPTRMICNRLRGLENGMIPTWYEFCILIFLNVYHIPIKGPSLNSCHSRCDNTRAGPE